MEKMLLYLLGWMDAYSKVGLIAVVMLWGLPIQAQETPSAISDDNRYAIEQVLEQGAEEEGAFDLDDEPIFSTETAGKAIDLNAATAEELLALGFISPIQVEALFAYREKYGLLLSPYELQAVPLFDEATIARLATIASLAPVQRDTLGLGRMIARSRSEVYFRWQRTAETKQGYTPVPEGETATRYEGSPDRLLLRGRLRYGDRLSLGFTAEKDAGETLFRGSNKAGFDFYGAHFAWQRVNRTIRTIVLGDFAASFGQGLIYWNGFVLAKGSNAVNVRRAALPLRPYTSAQEFGFQRGGGLVVRFGKIEAVAFASRQRRDANVYVPDSTQLEEQFIESLLASGLHRTPNEINNERAATLSTAGASLKWRHSRGHIALNGLAHRLTPPLSDDLALYRSYGWSGETLLNGSLDYLHRLRKSSFFGETALSENGAVATVNGLETLLSDRVALAVLHRYYARDFQSLLGNPFGETSPTGNESGFYMGTTVQTGKRFTLNLYTDLFSFPGWSYNNDQVRSPSYDLFGRLTWQATRQTLAYLQVRHKQTYRNTPGNDSPFNQPITRTVTRARLHVEHQLADALRWRSRIEVSYSQFDSRGRGLLLIQDLTWTPQRMPLRLDGRIAFFDVNDFDAAIYAYESDVLLSFSAPAFSGRGMRTLLHLRLEVNRHFDVWLRFAQTAFSDRETVGSSLETIVGNTRTEWKAQMRLRW